MKNNIIEQKFPHISMTISVKSHRFLLGWEKNIDICWLTKWKYISSKYGLFLSDTIHVTGISLFVWAFAGSLTISIGDFLNGLK